MPKNYLIEGKYSIHVSLVTPFDHSSPPRHVAQRFKPIPAETIWILIQNREVTTLSVHHLYHRLSMLICCIETTVFSETFHNKFVNTPLKLQRWRSRFQTTEFLEQHLWCEHPTSRYGIMDVLMRFHGPKIKRQHSEIDSTNRIIELDIPIAQQKYGLSR